ncbi:MAG: ice-binding family protein [Acidimicrobiales bacterium]
MTAPEHLTSSNPGVGPPWSRAAKARVVVAIAAVLTALSVSPAAAAQAPVAMGTADTFALLAAAGIVNTGATTVQGDLGSYPAAVSGSGTMTVNGTNHGGDAVTRGAQGDLTTAYDAAESEGPSTPLPSELGGQSLTPGVYSSPTSIDVSGNMTLDGGGDPNAVFVLQIGTDLTTGSSSQVVLADGAQACNVFWQVAGTSTIGAGAAFSGTVMASGDIAVDSAAAVDGRMLTESGSITIDAASVTVPACSAPTTTTTTTAPGPSPATGVPQSQHQVGDSGAGSKPPSPPATTTPHTTTTTASSTTTTTTTTTTAPPPLPGAGGSNAKLNLGGPIGPGGTPTAGGLTWWLIAGGVLLAGAASFGGFRWRRHRRVGP